MFVNKYLATTVKFNTSFVGMTNSNFGNISTFLKVNMLERTVSVWYQKDIVVNDLVSFKYQ